MSGTWSYCPVCMSEFPDIAGCLNTGTQELFCSFSCALFNCALKAEVDSGESTEKTTGQILE